MKLARQHVDPWPSPRDITIALDDHEAPSPAFALVRQQPFIDAIEPHLDGRRYQYVQEVHFDDVHFDKEAAIFDRGAADVIRFASSADSFDKFARDYWQAIRQYLGVIARRAMVEKAVIRKKAKREGRLP